MAGLLRQSPGHSEAAGVLPFSVGSAVGRPRFGSVWVVESAGEVGGPLTGHAAQSYAMEISQAQGSDRAIHAQSVLCRVGGLFLSHGGSRIGQYGSCAVCGASVREGVFTLLVGIFWLCLALLSCAPLGSEFVGHALGDRLSSSWPSLCLETRAACAKNHIKTPGATLLEGAFE